MHVRSTSGLGGLAALPDSSQSWAVFEPQIRRDPTAQESTHSGDMGSNPFFNLAPDVYLLQLPFSFYIAPDPTDDGYQFVFAQGPAGSVFKHRAKKENNMWRDIAVLAAMVVTIGYAATMAAAAGATGGVTATGTITAAEAATSEALFDAYVAQQAAAESLVSLEAFGGTTASWEGYLTAASTSAGTVTTDLYANETAKFLQQQALSQSGVDLLSTSLPTIDLSGSLMPDWLTPKSALNALSTAKTVIGVAAMAAGATSGSRTPSRQATSSGAGYQTQSYAQPMVGNGYAAQEDYSMWIIAAAVVAGLLI
jgi:hypothetical protein